MSKYVRKVPEIIEAEQITEEKYDGYVNVCAHHLDSLVFIDERREEEAYRNSDFRCDWEDDGHCMKKDGKPCEHLRKIGFIKLLDYKYAYPMVGDYMIVDENKKISFMSSEKFERMYELALHEPTND